MKDFIEKMTAGAIYEPRLYEDVTSYMERMVRLRILFVGLDRYDVGRQKCIPTVPAASFPSESFLGIVCLTFSFSLQFS